MLFHAVDKRILPEENYGRWPSQLADFHRNLYLSPVTIRIGEDGAPQFEICEPV